MQESVSGGRACMTYRTPNPNLQPPSASQPPTANQPIINRQNCQNRRTKLPASPCVRYTIAVHTNTGGARGAEALIRQGGRHLELRRHPVHPAVRLAALPRRQHAGGGFGGFWGLGLGLARVCVFWEGQRVGTQGACLVIWGVGVAGRFTWPCTAIARRCGGCGVGLTCDVGLGWDMLRYVCGEVGAVCGRVWACAGRVRGVCKEAGAGAGAAAAAASTDPPHSSHSVQPPNLPQPF